tara:strand:+ start:3020 stop:3841 length:822 start_codon:yes stop_codon:yes gene_type:complete
MGFSRPDHSVKNYSPVRQCIYCDCTEDLTNEHIIAKGLGGRWTLPLSSCKKCAAITGKFEGDVLREIVGPLRMLYDFPTRRPKDRPDHLPLKVQYAPDQEWDVVMVDRRIYPFLVVLPLYELPKLIDGDTLLTGDQTAAKDFWIRGTQATPSLDAHLEKFCRILNAYRVMPVGTVNTLSFCRMLAKIAHSYCCAEIDSLTFYPYLVEAIRNPKFEKREWLLGGGRGDEPPNDNLHELSLVSNSAWPDHLLVVQIRLFAFLGGPTYYAVVGRRK